MKIKVNKHKSNVHYRGSPWGSRSHAYCLRYAYGSILALNRDKYSPITYGWFGPKGWNESQPGWNRLLMGHGSWRGWIRLLMGHGSWRGWIRLWPARLNWHFGAKTDLFNFQCTTWKWVGSVIPENQRANFVTEWIFWYGSKLRKKYLFQNKPTLTQRLRRESWGHEQGGQKVPRNPSNQTVTGLADFLFTWENTLLAKASYHCLTSSF